MLFLSRVSWEGWARLTEGKPDAKVSIPLIYPPYSSGQGHCMGYERLIRTSQTNFVLLPFDLFTDIRTNYENWRDNFIVCCWRKSVCFAREVKVFELNGTVIICEHFQLSPGKVQSIFGMVGQVWRKRDGPGIGPETKVIRRIFWENSICPDSCNLWATCDWWLYLKHCLKINFLWRWHILPIHDVGDINNFE